MSSLQNHGLLACLVDGHGREFSRVFGFPNHGSARAGIHVKPAGAQVWLRELVDYCDQHHLKIRAISTPQTILSDIHCRSIDGLSYPEMRMLSKIGRSDLFVPPSLSLAA